MSLYWLRGPCHSNWTACCERMPSEISHRNMREPNAYIGEHVSVLPSFHMLRVWNYTTSVVWAEFVYKHRSVILQNPVLRCSVCYIYTRFFFLHLVRAKYYYLFHFYHHISHLCLTLSKHSSKFIILRFTRAIYYFRSCWFLIYTSSTYTSTYTTSCSKFYSPFFFFFFLFLFCSAIYVSHT